MPATGYRFQMAGGVPVVTAPAEIDTATTVIELRAILFEWQRRGHTTVVVDMTATRFCDTAGLRELVQAHKQAVAGGGGLRLVIPADGALGRVFTVTGLDGIPYFPTMTQALAQVPAAASRSLRRGPLPGPASGPASSAADSREYGGWAADSRSCTQCGAVFVPRPEHARFCGDDCRAAWNGEHLGDPVVEASTLTWSMAAMSEATTRLPAVKVWDQPQAFAAIGEAVWWITMVDATLVRHYLAAYDTAMAAHTPAERRLIAETMAGLRFARNWISRGAGLDEAIEPGAGTRRITQWTWKIIPEPAHAWLPPRAQAWELARYRAYQARLAGHALGEIVGLLVPFLSLTGANATSAADTGDRQPS